METSNQAVAYGKETHCRPTSFCFVLRAFIGCYTKLLREVKFRVSICRNGPKLTHLFFADDSLLFCRATTHDCQKVLEILSNYERVSGQKLNREKTALFFSKSTPNEKQSEIMDLLGVVELKQYEEYLGLPALVGRNKRASFDRLK